MADTSQWARFDQMMESLDDSTEALAKHFGWKTTTITRRIQDALPARLEQAAYLTLSREMEWRGFPETFRDILRYFTGGVELSVDRLEDRHFNMRGKRISEEQARREGSLMTNTGERILESVALTMELSNWAKSEGYALPARDLTRLVHAYGEHAEYILGMIGEQLEEIRDAFKWKQPLPAVMSMVVRRVAECAADADGATSVPNVGCIDDVIALFRQDVPREGWRSE